MEKEDHAAGHGALLDQLSDPHVWVDHSAPGKRCVQHSFNEAGHYSGASENSLFLSGSCHRYGVCTAAVYGALRVFQRGKDGLVISGGRKGSGCQPPNGIFDGNPEADAAAAGYSWEISGII